jgi:hypothetical protein
VGICYLFEIHALHGGIHAFDYVCHTARYLPHRHRRLYTRAHGVYSGREAEEVEVLVLLADRILGVDFGDVGVVLLDRLTSRC